MFFCRTIQVDAACRSFRFALIVFGSPSVHLCFAFHLCLWHPLTFTMTCVMALRSLRWYEGVSPGRCLACVNIVGFLYSLYIPPRHIKTLAIANRERVGLWSVTFSALRIKLCVASVSNRVIARKSGKFCSRPNFLDNLARKRMLRRADKGWSVGRWNERVRAERCEVVDWDQILNLQRSRTATWDYQGNIGKWDTTEFSNSSRKRGKSARASFILRITHHLKSGVLVSSPNIYLPCYAGYLQRILLNLSL